MDTDINNEKSNPNAPVDTDFLLSHLIHQDSVYTTHQQC